MDYKLDESYTPSKVAVRAGTNFHDLTVSNTFLVRLPGPLTALKCKVKKVNQRALACPRLLLCRMEISVIEEKVMPAKSLAHVHSIVIPQQSLKNSKAWEHVSMVITPMMFSWAQQVAVKELEEPDGWVDIDTLDKDERSVRALHHKKW